MTEQLTFPTDSLDDRFRDFHAKNPFVYDLLERMTADRIAAGHRRVGVKRLVEDIRWDERRPTTGRPWRIDNSLVSRYARLLLAEHPEWAGFIETRSLAGDRA
jgi:hypothetical protein